MITHLVQGEDFDAFLAAMIEIGCEVKRGKHLAFKIPDGRKFIRCDSLGDNYTEAAILERLSGRRMVATKTKIAAPIATENKPNLLIDIQAKMQDGKGEGYRHWGTMFNLKEMSKTLIFLKENGIDSYDDLVQKSNAASVEFKERLAKIKTIEKRLAGISELQKHIGTYSKTRDIYAKYKASGWDADFYEQFRTDITLHKSAKKYFDGLSLKKLPSINSLKQEYAALLVEKKKLYSDYHEMKEKRTALLIAKGNAERMLGVTPDTRNRDIFHDR